MIRGLYVSGTAMLTLEKHMNTLANNIANADTTGFRSDAYVQRAFKDVLIDRLNDPSVVAQNRQVGPFDFGVHVDELSTRFLQGALQPTGRPMDMALTGENAFFSVQTPGGVRYTRDGAFQLSADGRLVTSDGYPVLGTGGPINVGNGDFSVNEEGAVFVGEEQVGQLAIVGFADQAALRKEGANLFFGGAPGAKGAGVAVKQGVLEASNTDMGMMTTDMMWVYRAYETNQRFVQMTDGTLDMAVNRIGKV